MPRQWPRAATAISILRPAISCSRRAICGNAATAATRAAATARGSRAEDRMGFVLIGGPEAVNNLLRATFTGVVADLGAGSGSYLDVASSLSIAQLRPALYVE